MQFRNRVLLEAYNSDIKNQSKVDFISIYIVIVEHTTPNFRAKFC